MELDTINAVAAIVAALFGGVGVKILEKLMNKNSEHFLEGSMIREELRKERDALRLEVDELQKQVDSWRGKYYEQVEEVMVAHQNLDQYRIEVQRKELDAEVTKPTEE